MLLYLPDYNYKSNICKKLGCTMTTVHKNIALLEKYKLITSFQKDRRIIYKLTPKGKCLYLQLLDLQKCLK